MIVETVKLNEINVFTELFLGISILYLVIFSLFVSCNSNYRFILIQSTLINLCILTVIMCCVLIFNDELINLKIVSFCNSIVSDYLSFFSKILISFSTIVCLLFIKEYLINQKINQFEYIILLMFSLLGLFLLCCANDFLTTYLGMELQSLSFYLLATFKKRSSQAVDSGLKYFILGALSSSLFLFGSSLIYGVFGSINFEELKVLSVIYNAEINETIDYSKINYFTTVGLMFIFFSLFFKLALAPFHLWSPDIYEGSPSSSSFFFAVVPKIAIFVVLVRISYYAFFEGFFWLQEIISIIAVASVIVGSLGGFFQRKIKSLLAYSSISHMGYLTIVFSAGTFDGFQMLFCYLIVYMFSGLVIWSIYMLTRLKQKDLIKQNKDLADFVLLSKSNSMLALIFMTALFSIAGIPPLIGFIAKLNIFLTAIENSMYIVAGISVLFSVLSTFFYLRIIKILYFEPVLVGQLYYSINSVAVFLIVLIFNFFIFSFANPTILYLISYKIGLFFICIFSSVG